MARIRSIKPAFFTSEDTCLCSPLARLLFLGLLTEADKAGRVEDRPWQLKIRLLPNDPCDIDELLWQLVERRLVRRYASGDKLVIQIINFDKHQKPHPKEAESQLPANGNDRVKPGKETASPEIISNHPVENPSCPARNGSGSGDLSNGSGDLGSGVVIAEARPSGRTPSLIVSPLQFHKLHGTHVLEFCEWHCLPQSVFDDFVRLVIGSGADEPSAIAQVTAWAKTVRVAWSGRIPGDNIFDFWRNEWRAEHGSNKPSTAAGAVDVLAGLR